MYMAHDMLLLIVLMTSSKIIAQNMDDFVFPVNTAVLQGTRSELRCRPNSSSDVHSWMFQPAGTAEGDFIYSSGIGARNKMASYYVRKHSDGSVDLIINSTELSHAGLYTCMIRVNVSEEGASTVIQQRAELIVLEKEPEVKENECTEIQCTVSYRGNWAPVIKWRQNDGYNESIIRDEDENATVSKVTVSNATVSTVTHVTSTLRLVARNGVHYTCIAYFNESVNIDHDASKTTIKTCTGTLQLDKNSNSTSAKSQYNPYTSIIIVVVFAAAFSAVVVFLLRKRKVKRRATNSVQRMLVQQKGDEPLNEDDHFEDVCLPVPVYEEVADFERPPVVQKSLTRVQINGKTRLLGEDGTEYLDINGLKEQKQSTSHTEEPHFRVSEYALIHHNSDMQRYS